MDDDTRLPDDDDDLDLARRIGDGLERGSLEEDFGKPETGAFPGALLAFKKQTVERSDVPSADASDRMWARVDADTTERTARVDADTTERPTRVDADTTKQPARLDREPARRPHRTRRWVWAAAAALAAAGVIAVLTLNGPEATLVAGADSAVVEFVGPDGSVITLRPHTDLYLLAESDGGTTYRIDGEAYFDVTPQSDGVFAVEAGHGRVEVLGTRFNISTWSAGTIVYLEEGRVRFIHRTTGDEVELLPGEWSRLTDVGSLLPPQAEPPDEHLDWLDGEMRFQEQPVRLVAAELEHHFALSLDIPAPVGDETLTGRILLDDQEQSLQDLGQVIGGRFVEVGPNSYRFTSP